MSAFFRGSEQGGEFSFFLIFRAFPPRRLSGQNNSQLQGLQGGYFLLCFWWGGCCRPLSTCRPYAPQGAPWEGLCRMLRGSNASRDTWIECWAEPKGGGKTAGGAKPRKDGPSETIFGDPPKTVFEGVTWGKFWVFVRDFIREMTFGGGGDVPGWGAGRKLFSVGVLLVRFCPPPLFCPPPFGVLW